MSQPTLSSSAQPTDIYGGDEVSAIVLDPGYFHTRAGFAGEDVPKSIVPSFYTYQNQSAESSSSSSSPYYFGEEFLIPRANTEVRNYMSRDSVVEDWDAATKVWEHVLVRRLQPEKVFASRNGGNGKKIRTGTEAAKTDEEGDVAMDDTNAAQKSETAAEPDAEAADATENEERPLSENPLLITEAPWNTPKAREKTMEIAMESWGCPAFWFSKTPVLAAFAAGKATALVLDVGGANTSVTVVHDGMVLKRSVQKSPVGGLWLSEQVRSLFTEGKIDTLPATLVETKKPVDAGAPPQFKPRSFDFEVSPSYRAYAEQRLFTEFKESVVEVWRNGGRLSAPGNEDVARSLPGHVFEMPTGYNQMWREQRFQVAEGMWDEKAALPSVSSSAPSSSETEGEAGSQSITKSQTIPELIQAALNSVDVDLRPNLLGNVVVTGSSSLLRGFNDRLHLELTTLYPGVKIKIHAAGLTTERRFGAWIGGSILASLGTFHQMWISRKEYEELGPNVVEKRCK